MMHVYNVVAEVTIRETVRTLAHTPQQAADDIQALMIMKYPEAKVDVKQVDYRTEHGGESHYYPNTI